MEVEPEKFDWTDEVIGKLRLWWAEGHSTAEIGRRLGVSKNAIVGKKKRLGLEDRPSPIKSLAWPDEMLGRLRLLKSRGMSDRAMAAELGVSKTAISYHIKRLGITRRSASSIPRLETFGASETVIPLEAFRPVIRPKEAKVVTPKPKPIPAPPRAAFPTRSPSPHKTCQFPFGTPRQPDFRFCGEPTVPGKSYCLRCCKTVYVKVRDDDQDAAD